jgi:hypothetical protein
MKSPILLINNYIPRIVYNYLPFVKFLSNMPSFDFKESKLQHVNSDHSLLVIYYDTDEWNRVGNLSVCKKVTTNTEIIFLLLLKNLCLETSELAKAQVVLNLLDSISLFNLAWDSLPENSQICFAERYGFYRDEVNRRMRHFEANRSEVNRRKGSTVFVKNI